MLPRSRSQSRSTHLEGQCFVEEIKKLNSQTCKILSWGILITRNLRMMISLETTFLRTDPITALRWGQKLLLNWPMREYHPRKQSRGYTGYKIRERAQEREKVALITETHRHSSALILQRRKVSEGLSAKLLCKQKKPPTSPPMLR